MKVGDRVYHRLAPHKVGEVRHIQGNDIAVTWDVQRFMSVGTYKHTAWYTPDELAVTE